MNVKRLLSFDVYLIPNDCCSEPYVLTLPPDVALHICAFADDAVLKLVPNYKDVADDYGMSSLSGSEEQE